MQINLTFDCTPEEARRFMGLPDVTRANEIYVENFARAMQGVTSVDQLQEYARQLAPMGQMGMKLFQDFMGAAMRPENFRSGAGAGPVKGSGQSGEGKTAA